MPNSTVSKTAAIAVTASALVLSACAESQFADTAVSSGIGRVSGSTINASLESEINRSVTNRSVGTTAFVFGFDAEANQLQALTGIAAGASVGGAVTSGIAFYDATYGFIIAGDADRDNRGTSWSELPWQDDITLTANFSSGTLTGRDQISVTRNGEDASMDMSVNGTISGSDLGGSVTFSRLDPSGPEFTLRAALTGDIGSTGVIGAFHGASTSTDVLEGSASDGSLVAGGFVGTRN